jgi:hypothetical protein
MHVSFVVDLLQLTSFGAAVALFLNSAVERISIAGEPPSGRKDPERIGATVELVTSVIGLLSALGLAWIIVSRTRSAPLKVFVIAVVLLAAAVLVDNALAFGMMYRARWSTLALRSALLGVWAAVIVMTLVRRARGRRRDTFLPAASESLWNRPESSVGEDEQEELWALHENWHQTIRQNRQEADLRRAVDEDVVNFIDNQPQQAVQ